MLKKYVFNNHRTVLFAYAPGICDGRCLELEQVKTLTGTAFKTPAVSTVQRDGWKSVYVPAEVASRGSPFQNRPPRSSPSFSSVSICVYLWLSFFAYSLRRLDEDLPRGLPFPFRSRLHAMVSEDIANGFIADLVTKVCQGALDLVVSLGQIFPGNVFMASILS